MVAVREAVKKAVEEAKGRAEAVEVDSADSADQAEKGFRGKLRVDANAEMATNLSTDLTTTRRFITVRTYPHTDSHFFCGRNSMAE